MQSCAPPVFWVEALNTATYLLNRHPSKATGPLTLFELLFGVPPEYVHLCIFGCLYFPNMSSTSTDKICARSAPCSFLGYLAYHKGYRCFNLATRKVITSRHVVFDETQFPFVIVLVSSLPAELVPFCSTTLPSPACMDGDPPPPSWWHPPLPHGPSGTSPKPASTSSLASTLTPARGPPSSHTLGSPPQAATPPVSTPPLIGVVALHSPASTPTTTGDVVVPSSQPKASTSTSPNTWRVSMVPRCHVAPSAPHPMVTRAKAGLFFPNKKYAMAATASTDTLSPVPKSVWVVLADLNWRAAMQLEYDTLIANRTWTLEKPSGQYLDLISDESLICHGLNSNLGHFSCFTFIFVSCLRIVFVRLMVCR
jgi:hypothetical protein